MKVRINLFGALRIQALNYTDSQLEIELPAGARVKDLLQRLKIEDSRKVIATAENRILEEDDQLPPRAEISLLPPAFGG
ncbi:MAG: MoaD/ThiS family protein [Desulfohalobiaceae bacterium]|nr:MoaD/ThiS family protein [Desulfohalobiaceae bacterium]